MNGYVSFGPPPDRPVLNISTDETGADGERLCEIPEELAHRMRAVSTAFREAKEALLQHLADTGQWNEGWPTG